MGFLTGSEKEKSLGGEEILDIVSDISPVLLRVESGSAQDRELIITESGLIGIRWKSKGGLYDIHDKSINFDRNNGLYRVQMGNYAIRLSEDDFRKVLKTYNRLRDTE